MNSTLLLTRPNYDIATNYLYFWSDDIIKYTYGFKILDLRGNKANYNDFTSYMNKHKPSVVVFNGHGSDKTILGQNGEVLIKSDVNDDLLRGKIIYARCCEAGKFLGPNCVRKGAKAFVGYKKNYYLAYSDSHISRPLQDPVAKLFLEPSNLVPKSILKGNTVKLAYEKSQKAILKNIHFMISTVASDDQRDAAPYLWANKINQILFE